MDRVHEDLAVLARLLLAAALGGAVGWERLRAGKWVGIRTLMLIAVASALFAELTSMIVAASHSADPTRAVQAISLGIGFLGAGIIHVDRNNELRGLTTAAVVWATAAMGLTVGLRRYALAVGVAALLLVILRVVVLLERSEKGSHAPGER